MLDAGLIIAMFSAVPIGCKIVDYQKKQEEERRNLWWRTYEETKER